MNKILPIAAITFKEGIRNRALQGILCIAVLLCLIYLAIIPMFAFETGKVMVDLGAASVSMAGLVIVVFLAINMLTRDIHQRSVCMILSRPVSRQAYVIGKFGGLSLMVLSAILLIVMVAVASTYIGARLIPEMTLPRNFTFAQLVITFLFKYISLLILLAVAFLFTVLTTNEYISMLLTMMVYFIGNSLETIIKVASAGDDVVLSQSYLTALKICSWVFPNFSAFDLKVYLAYGLQLSYNNVLWTAIYGITYIIIITVITTFIFSSKEIR